MYRNILNLYIYIYIVAEMIWNFTVSKKIKNKYRIKNVNKGAFVKGMYHCGVDFVCVIKLGEYLARKSVHKIIHKRSNITRSSKTESFGGNLH